MIRNTVLLPSWHESRDQPCIEEIKEVMALAQWSAADFAKSVGVQPQMVYRWLREGEQGEIMHPISFSAWAILCAQAGLGFIWRL